MKKKDLDELVTVSDLEKGINELRGLILSAINPQKDFLTPKEFSARTGMNYSTVIYKCTMGKLKAFQESPNSSWLIDATEIERFRKQADENQNEPLKDQ
jgi:hypothetical protein